MHTSSLYLFLTYTLTHTYTHSVSLSLLLFLSNTLSTFILLLSFCSFNAYFFLHFPSLNGSIHVITSSFLSPASIYFLSLYVFVTISVPVYLLRFAFSLFVYFFSFFSLSISPCLSLSYTHTNTNTSRRILLHTWSPNISPTHLAS